MKRAAKAGALALLAFASRARADAPAGDDDAMPPWVDQGDVPVPGWARSVAPTRADAAFYTEPGKLDSRRGSAQLGARLPLYATRRANGCQGRWLNVGPFAWICSDVAEYSGDGPGAPAQGTRTWTLDHNVDAIHPTRPGSRPLPPIEPFATTDDGLPFHYFFAGASGAYGFTNLANALDDSPDQELEQGFAIAATEEKSAHGEAWIKSKKGFWFSTKELVPAHAFLFHGERVSEKGLDFAWVVGDKASVYASPKADKATGVRARFEKVHAAEENNGMIRVSEEGLPAEWMRAKDLGRPRVSALPTEVGAGERWIDVDLAQQTLVAYEGERPVFATIVSTGRGAKGTDAATPPGVHRIWVKIFATKMDNLDKDDVDKHFALEDVPWVQFFDKAVALHGAFWHRDFGHVHSHGCVNLAPIDARWLFAFTGPHVPVGWTAAYPTRSEPGTTVRVR